MGPWSTTMEHSMYDVPIGSMVHFLFLLCVSWLLPLEGLGREEFMSHACITPSLCLRLRSTRTDDSFLFRSIGHAFYLRHTGQWYLSISLKACRGLSIYVSSGEGNSSSQNSTQCLIPRIKLRKLHRHILVGEVACTMFFLDSFSIYKDHAIVALPIWVSLG